MTMWDRPEFEHFRKQRDENPRIPSLVTAFEIIEKELRGRPLNAAEREYLNLFYSTHITQEFFCRLGLTMEHIGQCWYDGKPPTDEQCSRCELSHRTVTATMETITIPPVPDKEIRAGLYSEVEDGVVRYTWRYLNQNSDFKGLAGSYIPGLTIHPKTPLDRVFPICIPSLSKKFEGGCDRQCHKCPAHGTYDSVRDCIITGNGTVLITDNDFKGSMAETLNQLKENLNDSGNPT